MSQPAAPVGGALQGSVDALAAQVVAMYAAAEQQLTATLAAAARRGLTDSGIQAQLAMLARMRQAAERVAITLQLRTSPLATRIAAEAAQRGDAAAQAAIRAAVAGHPSLATAYLARTAGMSGHAVAAVNAIALELTGKLAATRQGILRFADDAYRAAVADATTRLVLGREDLTPATAQRLAWRELTRAGISGYTDRAGHRWNLASYVEMATRTATQRAYNDAHQNRMTSVGIRYFTIASDGHPCPLCRPFEGAVLSTGVTGRVSEENAVTGRPVTITVKATVDQARAAGLFHPNCRHVLIPYLPGVTKTSPTSTWSKADDHRYHATQRLRALERRVRAAKREQAAALTPVDAQHAGRKVRAAQAEIRAHLAQHGDLVRRPRREQPTLGNAAGGGGGAKPPSPPDPPSTGGGGDGPDDPFDSIPSPSSAITNPDLSRLTADERAAIAYYTAENFSPVNKVLRAGRDPLPRFVADSVQDIDSGLAKYPLPQRVRVARGVHVRAFGLNSPADTPAIVGHRFTEDAYLSTTLNPAPTDEFLGSANVLLELVVPAGTHALMVGGLSEFPTEREVLIERGRTLLIVSAAYDESLRRWRLRAAIESET